MKRTKNQAGYAKMLNRGQRIFVTLDMFSTFDNLAFSHMTLKFDPELWKKRVTYRHNMNLPI